MNTKPLMVASAIFLGVIGIAFTFLPDELLHYFQINTVKPLLLVLQLLGALYFSLAILNWMAKGSVIGGIYNRPIAIANFAHFLIGGLALLKAVFNTAHLPLAIYILAGIYAVFAFLFWWLFSHNPPMRTNAKVNQ